jgi:hypothetical protein
METDMFYQSNRLITAAALLLSGLTLSVQAADINSVQQATVHTLQKEQSAQQTTDKWTEEKRALVNDILDQKTRLQWNRYQNDKYRTYIERKQVEVAELQTRKEKMRQLRMALEPYLDQVLIRLEEFVAADRPFLKEERSARLDFLRRSLTDPELSLGEKLRRVLEGLKIEAEYGNHIEVTSEKLDLDGQNTLVSMLRLGRVGLFYITKDGKNLGMWDTHNKQWVHLEDRYAAPLQLTMDIVERRRAAELVELPLTQNYPDRS